MSADFFDYDELDPGIRSTVALLNSLGFNTCDSGDGRTKIEKGEADGVPPEEVCAENEPNVYMRPLGEAFDELVLGPTPAELAAAGRLSAPRAWTVPTDEELAATLGEVETRGGDYAEEQLGRAMNKPALVGSLVDHYQRLGDGQRGVVYAVMHTASAGER